MGIMGIRVAKCCPPPLIKKLNSVTHTMVVPSFILSTMSALTLSGSTIIFTGATIEDTHTNIRNYVLEKDIMTPSKPFIGATIKDTHTNISNYVLEKDIMIPSKPFIGEQGELLNDVTDTKILNDPVYKSVRETLLNNPPKLAAAARLQAAKNSYGSDPELVTLYIYYRWMIPQMEYVASRISYLRKITPNPLSLLHPSIHGFTLFKDKIQEIAILLVKSGWLAPIATGKKYHLKGTQFQKIAIDCNNVLINGYPPCTSAHGSINPYRLYKSLQKQS
jgi:hypothetical protein